MTRVYISSTYDDLSTYRVAVYDALRQMHVDVRDTMEHGVASDERSLAACLEAVSKCDVYVGIFAYRYGYQPEHGNPERKSITELEYRRANNLFSGSNELDHPEALELRRMLSAYMQRLHGMRSAICPRTSCFTFPAVGSSSEIFKRW